MFLLRLVIGGSIVALIPYLASHVNARLAGVVMTIPIISLLGLFFTLNTAGETAAKRVAFSALIALIPLTIFFLSVIYGLGKYSGNYILFLAFCIWILSSSVMFLFIK